MIHTLPTPEIESLRRRSRPFLPAGADSAKGRKVTAEPAADAYGELPVLTAGGHLTAVRRDYAGRCGAGDTADGFRAADWVVCFPGAGWSGSWDTATAAFRRGFDIAAALVGLALTLPFYPVFIAMVLWKAPGPIFYRLRRQSVGGCEFGCLKFRTMVVDADSRLEQLRAANEVDGPQFKMADDPRVTPGGRILRALNLDELPQFFNVLAGTMSLVGPRPSPDVENRQCPAWREARLSVRPGITGLWQVSRTRDREAGDFAEWIQYDTAYVRRRSIVSDLWIVAATLPVLFPVGRLWRRLTAKFRGLPAGRSDAQQA